MSYNLEEFGNQIRSIRDKLNLTQRKVSEHSGICQDTLRKIENGKVLPTQETLDLLSIVLKKDLNQILLSMRINNSNKFNQIKNKIEAKLDRDNHQNMLEDLDELKLFLNSNSHPYFILIISQYAHLIESIILNKTHGKIEHSLNYLLKAMSLTTPQFSLDNYKDFVYSSLELRILMSIALRINRIDSPEKSLEILEFCFKSIDPVDKLYPKLCFNLSYSYHRLDRHAKALEFTILGINYCNEYREYAGLNHLFFRKGIAEYLLGYETYSETLKKSVYFCEVIGDNNLKELIISNCKRIYNIELS